MEIGEGVGSKSGEDRPVGRARYQDCLGSVRVCWPGPIRCRSGNETAASTPKIAMLDGPLRLIAAWG